DGWDAVVIWYAKTRDILAWTPVGQLPYAAYPTLGPAMWALGLALGGLENEPVARLVFPAFWLAWAASLPLLVPGALQRRMTATALFALVLATLDFQAATSGYQDLMIASVAGAAALLLGRRLLEPGGPARGDVTL